MAQAISSRAFWTVAGSKMQVLPAWGISPKTGRKTTADHFDIWNVRIKTRIIAMETKLCLFLYIASAFYSQETTILSAKSKPAFSSLADSKKSKSSVESNQHKRALLQSPFLSRQTWPLVTRFGHSKFFQGKYVLRPKEPLKKPSNISGFWELQYMSKSHRCWSFGSPI